MTRIVVTEFLTLDGVMQAPGASDEDQEGGFAHGGWQFEREFFDDAFGQYLAASYSSSGGMLLGRRTYDIFAKYWPNQGPDNDFAATMNGLPKYVVSTTLREPLAWQNSHLISGDVAGELRRLKAADGQDLHVIGSAELVQTLVRHDLVDAYELMVHPVVIGTGKRLFHEEQPQPMHLRLLDSKTTTTGVLLLTYLPERG
jgi:dihydrofolate reductase